MNSARVLITGLRPDPSPGARGELPRCTDILVLGQAVRFLRAADGRPFLKRESLKRGAIRNVCHTRIHFIEAKKSYDFFADDGNAVTLTDQDVGRPADSNSAYAPEPPELGSPEDLTGKDLLRLIPQPGAFSQHAARPGDSTFDEQDLKEGAYFIVRRRSKAAVVTDNAGVAVAHSAAGGRPKDVNVHAGTLGRIEKRAGVRSEPLWVVELLPNSAPAPFWRSLLSLPGFWDETRALLSNVVLASSQIAEINDFFDRFGVEWTRFGEEPGLAATERDPENMRLPHIYGRPKVSLDENIAAAHEAGMLDLIQEAALGLLLVLKDSRLLARAGTLVLDESVLDESRGSSRGVIAPDLLRRQCFVPLDRLANSAQQPSELSPGAALAVTRVDVKAFQLRNSAQVPPDYYAIDLELLLKPNFGSGQVPLVCRFPSDPIDVGLVHVAERILSSRFEIRRRQ